MTVGVWVGRPDGTPVAGLVGRSVAAPILFDAFARSGLTPVPLPAAPKGAVFAAGNKLPPPLQRFNPSAGPAVVAEPPRIMFPPDGARIEAAEAGQNSLPLKIAGGLAPLTVMLNGVPVGPETGRRNLFVMTEGHGFVRLTVMDALGSSDSVMVRVQ
jgi:penicillin-binding protein 1C